MLIIMHTHFRLTEIINESFRAQIKENIVYLILAKIIWISS